jgi:uncharacterized protein
MGLFRLIIILAIAYVAYRLFTAWQRSSSQQPRKKDPEQVENVVRCHYCKLHIPETEAIEYQGRYYCSTQHLEQDKSK